MYPKGRLSIRRNQHDKEDPNVTEDFSTNSTCDGSILLKLFKHPATVASRALQKKKRTCDDRHLEAHANL
jgi:hypothetical protein